MSYRIQLKVIQDGEQIYHKQLLDNHEHLTKKQTKQLGLKPNKEGEFESEVALSALIEVFIEHYNERFNSMTESGWESTIELIKNSKSLIHQHPSVYLIGDYLITLHQLREFEFRDIESRQFPQKRKYILYGC